MSLFRICQYLLLAVVLSACTTTPPERTITTVTEDTVQREGRFSLLVYDKTRDKNSESVQGNFSLLSQKQQVVVDFQNPLGQVLARIESSADVARLIRPNEQVIEAANPDMLMYRVLGRPFPVSGLLYWMRGQAMPDYPMTKMEYDEKNRLIQFVQAQWIVKMSRYDTIGPKVFHLVNNETTERITIRIVMH